MATNDNKATVRRICANCDHWNFASALEDAVSELEMNDAGAGGEIADYLAGKTDKEKARWALEAVESECRRYPPRIGDEDGWWPHSRGGDWCGEWQPRRKDRGGDHG